MTHMVKDLKFMERIQMTVNSVGGQAAMAAATGLSKSVISKYVNGHSEPDRQRLIAIANAASVDLAWLTGGEGDSAQEDTEPDIVYLPFYSNSLALVKGDTAVHDRLIARDTLYPASQIFLHRVLHANNASDLGVFLVHGDCMEPTLKAGEVVIVDLTKLDLVDGIHLIVDKGGIHYRRIRLPYGKPVELYYDNKDMYQSEHLDDDQVDKLEIVGRVIWHGRKI